MEASKIIQESRGAESSVSKGLAEAHQTPTRSKRVGVCGGSLGWQNECTMDRETGIDRVECRKRDVVLK